MKKLIGDKQFYKMIFLVAFPIVIQNGITNFVNLLDNIMIGQLGTLSMSGVSIANQLMMVFNLAIFGVLSGPGIFMAQFYGKKDQKGMRDCFQFKLIAGTIVVAVALTVMILFGKDLVSMYLTNQHDSPGDTLKTLNYGLTYLHIMMVGVIPFMLSQAYSFSVRETGNTVLPMISSVTAVIVNFVFNYLLIFGKFGFPELGVAGAAIATVLSRFVELGIIVIGSHFVMHHEPLKGVYKQWDFPKETYMRITKKGFPLLVNEILWSGSQAIITQCYSTRGLSAIAAVNITMTVFNFFMIVCYAMGNAISIIVGQQLGSGELETAYDYDIKMIFTNFILCIIIGGLLFVCASYIPYAYKTSHEVRSIATTLLYITACMMPVVSLYYCSYFTLRAGGKTLLTFFFDSLYAVIFNVPVAFLLTRLTGLNIIFIYIIVQGLDIPKSFLGLYLVKKGIWIHNLVNEL